METWRSKIKKRGRTTEAIPRGSKKEEIGQTGAALLGMQWGMHQLLMGYVGDEFFEKNGKQKGGKGMTELWEGSQSFIGHSGGGTGEKG